MLKNFNKGKKLNYTFSHINVNFCRKYEEWLRARGHVLLTNICTRFEKY